MKTDVWMPLYIGDYLADTARLTTEQHGAYLLLIMDYWRSGKLPDNDQVLAQICKLSPDAWSNAKAMLKHYFRIENGFWIHDRVESELVLARQNRDKRQDRASKAARARWEKDSENATSNAPSNAPSIQQAVLNECPSPSPSPSPSPLSLPSSLPTPSTSSKEKKLPCPIFEKFWTAYPKKTGKQAALTAFAKIKNPENVVDQILDALAWQVESDQWRRDGGQYIPNPATYLNQGRWQDEPVTALREFNNQEMIEIRNRRVVEEYNAELRARGEM